MNDTILLVSLWRSGTWSQMGAERERGMARRACKDRAEAPSPVVLDPENSDVRNDLVHIRTGKVY